MVYRVEDTYRAALHVENYRTFIEDQAGAVVKRVAAQFPYESADASTTLSEEGERSKSRSGSLRNCKRR